MAETSQTPGYVFGAADDQDGASDDDPGPSSIDILIESDGWHEIDGAGYMVQRAHEACLEHIGSIAGRELSVLLSSDEAVAALNARFRGIDKPTNVLSFPASSEITVLGMERAPLGDIVIAYETVIREAREQNKAPSSHLAHLVVHGILHLAGYDHDSDDEAEQMETLERELLAGLGIPDPYPTNFEERLHQG